MAIFNFGKIPIMEEFFISLSFSSPAFSRIYKWLTCKVANQQTIKAIGWYLRHGRQNTSHSTDYENIKNWESAWNYPQNYFLIPVYEEEQLTRVLQ